MLALRSSGSNFTEDNETDQLLFEEAFYLAKIITQNEVDTPFYFFTFKASNKIRSAFQIIGTC